LEVSCLKATWNIGYNVGYAWVYSQVKTANGLKLEQSNISWRSGSILWFVFNGKTVSVTNEGLSVELDELDKEFLTLAKLIPASNYKLWYEVYEMLMKGKSKADVLTHLQTLAIARELNGKPSRKR
jgi:hypothetical protein